MVSWFPDTYDLETFKGNIFCLLESFIFLSPLSFLFTLSNCLCFNDIIVLPGENDLKKRKQFSLISSDFLTFLLLSKFSTVFLFILYFCSFYFLFSVFFVLPLSQFSHFFFHLIICLSYSPLLFLFFAFLYSLLYIHFTLTLSFSIDFFYFSFFSYSLP